MLKEKLQSIFFPTYVSNVLIFLIFGIQTTTSITQTSFSKTNFRAKLHATVHPATFEPDFHPSILHLEAPLPDGNSARSHLMNVKTQIAEEQKNQSTIQPKSFNAKSNMQFAIGRNHIPMRTLSNGSQLPLVAGIPSDNTLAISNDGIILLSMNSTVYAYDFNIDTTVITNEFISLRQIGNGTFSSTYYDPKLFYDPSVDRFILAFLKDFDPQNSEIVICFSSSSDPNDQWYVYNLPGNPLDNNRWTDFPAIAVTDDKLYFTANLIIPDVSWQIGFDGSVIWEMDKHKGFSGEEDIDIVFYNDIKYNDRFIRNLHPVQGADGIAHSMYFLSNRNFDIQNDTIFVLHLEGEELDVKALRTDLPYGVPPNARQFDTDTTDPTGGLQTNDARVLGAILFEDEIQFVANTRNPETGFSAIYHGFVFLMDGQPEVFGNILGDSIKDYGYPNIAWTGNENCDRETIIAFNHSSFEDFPGNTAIYYSNEGFYSPAKTIIEGYNYVNRLPTDYERWGDYYGLQRKYNEPGMVASFGYLALENNLNSGYLVELISPDTSKMHVQLSPQFNEGVCAHQLKAITANGIPPYSFRWNNSTDFTDDDLLLNICNGDTVILEVKDARDCIEAFTYVFPKGKLDENVNVYPNPTNDFIAVAFDMEETGKVTATIFDMSGRKVHEVASLTAKAGKNEFTMFLHPLAAGSYVLRLQLGDTNEVSHKFVKY